MKLNAYCIECLTRTKQHCEGRSDEKADDAAVNDVRLTFADGSYEPRLDYIQAGAGSDSSGRNRLHGLNFCPNYQLDPAQLPRMKSAQAIRDEFNAQRAANKAATKAEKDAEKKLKAKQKAQARRDKKQKADEEYERELKVQQAAVRHMGKAKTEKPEMPETPVVTQMADDEDFGDLII